MMGLGYSDHAAMTKGSPAVKGRPVRFTPQFIETIKELVAKGISREEIANRLGVTLGSLQVTCSRLRISLRRPGSGRGGALRMQPRPMALRTQPPFKVELIMRHEGKERTSDIPLALPVIGELALEAMSRDLKIAEL